MQKVSGTFIGTGAALYVGLGFVPDAVEIMNCEGTRAFLKWNKNMRDIDVAGGIYHKVITDADTADGGGGGGVNLVEVACTAGIVPFEADDVDPVSAASTVYLAKLAELDQREAQTTPVTTWTLGSAANRTGNVNAGLYTTQVGVGSMVRIRENVTGQVKTAQIVALTNDGDVANEVTLSRAIKSGKVLFVGPMADYQGIAAGEKPKAGFGLLATDVVNVSGVVASFTAELWD